MLEAFGASLFVMNFVAALPSVAATVEIAEASFAAAMADAVIADLATVMKSKMIVGFVAALQTLAVVACA